MSTVKLLPGSLQMIHSCHHFSFCGVLFHLEFKVNVTEVGSCCKEFEDILLLHLQDVKGSSHGEYFPQYGKRLIQFALKETM